MTHVAALAGARVVAAARRRDRLEAVAAAHEAIVPLPFDVTDASDRERAVATAVESFGRLDGLVNGAGAGDTGPALRRSFAGFEHVLALNLSATFAMSCAAAEAMRETGSGSIVNIASAMGLRSLSQIPDAAYVASKAGVIGLTRELASQWGRYGIRVNALAPGFFPSEMTAELLGPDGNDAPPWLTDQIALGRVGRSDELDEPVRFLLGRGSAYVTGHTLVVDGGMTTR
jgi:hypothetical protein